MDVLRPIFIGDSPLIVTSYDNLPSVLLMAMSLRPGLTFADKAAFRILLTDRNRPSGRVAFSSGMTPARLVSHFLRPSGLYLPDPRDIGAIAARNAVSSGAIRIRVVNPERLSRKNRRPPDGIILNMAVGEDFAALSSSGFSRRDMLDRAVLVDRVASNVPAYRARKEAAELFWGAGLPCNKEVLQILDGLIAPVEMEQMIATAVSSISGCRLFAPRTSTMSGIQSLLVSQALGRIYEHGFAFVSVPAGGGIAEINDEIARCLVDNAARMVGSPDLSWSFESETATGKKWSMDRVIDTLSRAAPLAMTCEAHDQKALQGYFRRLSCRYAPGTSLAVSGDGRFPDLRKEGIHVALTKAQQAAFAAVVSEIRQALASPLDQQGRFELERLLAIVFQSTEAAFALWKQGGMSTRVRYGEKVSIPAETDQSLLPMFGEMMIQDVERVDVIGEALGARAFRSIDRSRLEDIMRLVQVRGQALVIVEDDLARHALSRRLAEIGIGSILSIVPEAVLRRDALGLKDASYQRAENHDLAVSILASMQEPPSVILASSTEAAKLTLPSCASAVVLSAPDSTTGLAACLSSIDGLGKSVAEILFFHCEDGLQREAIRGLSVELSTLIDQAMQQMRSEIEEDRDGVHDVMQELSGRLPGDVALPDPGSLNIAVVESDQLFSLFVLAGISEDADQAAMPPRILMVLRDPATGSEHVLRNQVGCANFLAGIPWPARSSDPRTRVDTPHLDVLSVVGRHMSHLTHWDARPERLVAPLEYLARFVTREEKSAEQILSDLRLVSLEIIGRRWMGFLAESRALSSEKRPGLDLAYQALLDRPVWEIDDIREQMLALIDLRLVEDSGRTKTLHELVVAAIHGTGQKGLSV